MTLKQKETIRFIHVLMTVLSLRGKSLSVWKSFLDIKDLFSLQYMVYVIVVCEFLIVRVEILKGNPHCKKLVSQLDEWLGLYVLDESL